MNKKKLLWAMEKNTEARTRQAAAVFNVLDKTHGAKNSEYGVRSTQAS